MSIDESFNGNVLSDRKKMILKAVIESYIENGEPVGSKTLSASGILSCSPATIRNEMAELEELGYLEQPHTSAGRIPSEVGYRFYVDSLVEDYRFTENEIDEMKRSIRGKQVELDKLLDTAVRLASKFTDCTALTMKPRKKIITVSRFEVMQMEENVLLLVMIVGFSAKTKYIKCDVPLPKELPYHLAEVLNNYITNLGPGEITMPIVMNMEKAMGDYDFIVSPVVKAVCEALSTVDYGELRFDGVNRLLAYPEYYSFDKLSGMIDMFEKKDDLLEMLSDDAYTDNDDKVKVFIGRENLVKIMDNSTLIYKTIKKDGVPIGAIGIIGPTRMNYSRAIALIDSLTSGISNMLGDGKNDTENGDT